MKCDLLSSQHHMTSAVLKRTNERRRVGDSGIWRTSGGRMEANGKALSWQRWAKFPGVHLDLKGIRRWKWVEKLKKKDLVLRKRGGKLHCPSSELLILPCLRDPKLRQAPSVSQVRYIRVEPVEGGLAWELNHQFMVLFLWKSVSKSACKPLVWNMIKNPFIRLFTCGQFWKYNLSFRLQLLCSESPNTLYN